VKTSATTTDPSQQFAPRGQLPGPGTRPQEISPMNTQIGKLTTIITAAAAAIITLAMTQPS
jgi:hypothetical protein